MLSKTIPLAAAKIEIFMGYPIKKAKQKLCRFMSNLTDTIKSNLFKQFEYLLVQISCHFENIAIKPCTQELHFIAS